ncbi:MAG: hypothetical protein ABIS20_21065 [Thermoanaerobaculia bacterium]
MSWPRRTFDTLERGLAPLAARHLRMALPAASGLGALRNRLSRRWPSPEQVRTLFPHLPPRVAARAAWKIGALEARNRLLVDAIQRQGLEPVRRLMRPPSEAFAALRPPLILGTFHVGAMQGLGAAIERLPGPVLVLRLGALYSPSPPVEILSTEGDDQRRAFAFHRALTHLNGGGFVLMALDGSPGPGLRVPCLGRTLELARGPFALARLTGAPLVPLVARWRKSEVEAEVGTAIAGVEEGALAASAARWLEGYLMAAPEEIGLGLVRALLTPPFAAR